MKNVLTPQEQKQKDDFDRMANSAKNWFAKTRALHFAAKALFKIYDRARKEAQEHERAAAPTALFVSDQVLLLEAFAIECLLKGLYVAGGKKIAEDGKILKIVKGSHNLLGWCKKNAVELNDREESILRTLSRVMTSYGRYPVPMSYENNPRRRTKETGYSPLYAWSHNDLVLIDNIIISIIGDETHEA